ncbi:PadR family transcriptional regulator [Paenibacillus sp. YYML68]|uniref:PadR family transcriptional regulator n=1 Tax=Paenibacillus sp. YYML68 TaxID=2909250 RepID=UPI00249293B8|nr:PadR family transcriptional regulator [Paenibacillus sp. YYML68]
MSMKLVILGLLMECDSHPYELMQKMKERAMLHYIKMEEGSLYYAIDKLAQEAYVEVVAKVQLGGKRDRTIYRITERGTELFHELLDAQFAESKHIHHPLYAALAFAKHGRASRIHELLQHQIMEQQRIVTHLKDLYESHIHDVPRAVLHMMKGRLEHAVVELRWLERLSADAAADRLKMKGEPIDDAGAM